MNIKPMPFTMATAEHYARLKAYLAAKGRLKARMDLLIAAAALEAGAILVTYDQDFDPEDLPPDLTVENWYTPPSK